MNIFSISWWGQTLLSTLITMAMIYIIKQVAGKVQIPVVSTIVEEV